MATIRQKRDPVRLFWRRLLILGLFILVVAAGSGVWSAYQKERESAGLRAQAESQLSDLTKQQSQLDADITTLQTARGKEAVLRQQYALAAQGEGMIVIVDPATATAPSATSSAFATWLHNTFPWW
jgi:cell division protein FtsB